MNQMHKELIENRERKNQLLLQMLELTNRQKSQLMEDDVETLVQTSESWDALAREVDELQAAYVETERLMALQDGQDRQAGGMEDITRLNGAATEILKKIRGVQMECDIIAKEKTQKYKNDIKGIQKSNQRVTSYVNPYSGPEDGIYFDRKR